MDWAPYVGVRLLQWHMQLNSVLVSGKRDQRVVVANAKFYQNGEGDDRGPEQVGVRRKGSGRGTVRTLDVLTPS